MELRRLSLWLAFFVIAAISQCSEGHAVQKRETNNDDDYALDEASDDEAQNDENGDGEGEEEMNVNVSIVTKPTTYNVTAGSTVRLECKLDPPDSDAAVVQWSGNNQTYSISSVKTYNDVRYRLDENDLVIDQVMSSDSGTYFCEVLQRNPAKIQHNLMLMEAPKIAYFHATNDGHVSEGSSLTLTCDVTGTPPPQITWSKSNINKDGNEYNEKLTENAGTFTHNSLTIHQVTAQTAGRYYCYAFNSIGNSQKAIEIYVDAKPQALVPKEIINADINTTAVLQCSAHETPLPHIYWYKDNTLIENVEEYYSITTDGPYSNLTIKPRHDSDFGTYTCEARNALGVHRRSVEVVRAPVLRDVLVRRATLSWTVASHAPLTHVQLDVRNNLTNIWRTINIPLPSINGHEYFMKYTVNQQDLAPGVYEARIKAKNKNSEWSEHTPGAYFTVEEEALAIKQSAVFGSDGNRLYTSVMSTLLIYLLVRMF